MLSHAMEFVSPSVPNSLLSFSEIRMNRRTKQQRHERSENTKVRITDLSHRHTILFELQYVHLYTRASIYIPHTHTHVRVRKHVHRLHPYVCTNFGRSHGQRVRIYPLRFPLQGQKHFCPRQRVYKARNMNWRFTLIVRQEVRVCRINSHSRETRVSNIPSCRAVERKRRRGFSTLVPVHLPQKCVPTPAAAEKKHGVN